MLTLNTNDQGQKGNGMIIGLVAIVVIAIGVLAFLSGKMTGDKAAEAPEKAAQTSQQATADAPAQDAAPEIVIEPGNPVVAKLGGEDITRLQVFEFIQTLPAQTRQLPVQQLFPLALEQVINAKIIEKKTANVKLDNDPAVKQQVAAAKEQIVRTVFLQKEVEKGMTDERMQQAYEAYKKGFPKVDEAKARHILVAEASLAKDIIKQLNDGADFAELASEYSTDGTAENGGSLGYFTKTEVVPEFAEAAFALKPDAYTRKPVKSAFGYHVIMLEEIRERPPAEFEQAKPFLEGQLRRALLDKTVQDWRADADVERFDINGKKPQIVPAEAPATQAEPAEAAE